MMSPENQVLAAAQWLYQWTREPSWLWRFLIPRGCLAHFNETMRKFAEDQGR